MGTSFRLRLVGIVAITLFIAWSLLGTGSGDKPVAHSFANNDAVYKAAPAHTTAQVQQLPSPSAVVFDKPMSSLVPPKAGIETSEADNERDTQAAQAAAKAALLEAVNDESKTDESSDNSDTSSTVSGPKRPGFTVTEGAEKTEKLPQGTAKDDSNDSEDKKDDEEQTADSKDATEEKEKSTDPEDPAIPEEEMTEKQKEAERKKKERAAELRKQELEQKHKHNRDEKIKQLRKDPAMQARLMVTPEDIGVIIRTGDNVKHRLAGPLSTWASNRTSENTILFSDKEATFRGWRVQDAIKPWLNREKIKDTDAAKYWREHNGPQTDDQSTSNKQKRFDAWNLDALKFVSAAHLGYLQLREKRDFKWYIFADDDTYWHLSTLASLVSNLDYDDEYYMGGVSYFGIPFAHGGAGAVASAGAMKKRFIDHADSIIEYHDIGATAQYGDTNLARAFEAVDIFFDHSFTDMFNSDSPFHRGLDRGLICQHVVTYHHLNVEYFPKLHEKVKDLPILTYMKVMSLASAEDNPITEYWHKKDWSYNLDVKDTGTAKEAKDLRDNNWSFSVPERHRDMVSAKTCQEMCRDNDKCVAWTYMPNERTCSMSEWFRLGHAREGSVSGVDAMQFSEWVDSCKPWWPQ